jgi:hypothetical protein
VNVHVTDDGTRLVCAWFALCTNPAEWATRGPVGDGEFGMVPICQRCADRMGITDLVAYEIEVEV